MKSIIQQAQVPIHIFIIVDLLLLDSLSGNGRRPKISFSMLPERQNNVDLHATRENRKPRERHCWVKAEVGYLCRTGRVPISEHETAIPLVTALVTYRATRVTHPSRRSHLTAHLGSDASSDACRILLFHCVKMPYEYSGLYVSVGFQSLQLVPVLDQ
jgi:hypothetical protein